MIPAECDLSKRPVSEQIVFDAIKNNLSDEWKVFHSFDYLARDLNYMLWDGEIDFLLYHATLGFLVIEVKGGTISHRDGQWFQEDRPINPVGQAKKNKYAVRQLLEHKLLKAIPAKFAHAVCFPSCGKQMNWPVEAQDIVITGDTLPYIESFARQLLADTPLPENIHGSISEAEVLQVLTPVFEYGSKLSDRIKVEEKQFFHFTEQQCMILNALENFRRLQICGCAGSGKTLMAIKKAEQLAAQGKSVLLLCFNQLLAKYLKHCVKDNLLIRAAAFFEFAIENTRKIGYTNPYQTHIGGTSHDHYQGYNHWRYPDHRPPDCPSVPVHRHALPGLPRLPQRDGGAGLHGARRGSRGPAG
jgi:hypothetical protein